MDAIVVLPSQDKALLLTDLSVLQSVCESGGAVLSRHLTPSEIPSRSVPHSLTGLLWQTAIWSSRGRLMLGVSLDVPLRLKHWPNLTRLAAIPNAMRIAALWGRHPVNLRMTVKMLNVSASHIFDFLAAANATGIVDVHSISAVVAEQVPVVDEPQSVEQKVRGGLLSRLLRKVVGL
jgi:hypothetical protein